MATIIRNGHGEQSSNPCWGSQHFYTVLRPLGKVFNNYPLFIYGRIVEQTELFNFGVATGLGEGKLWIQTC